MRAARSIVFLLKSEFPAALFPFRAGVPAIGVGQRSDDEEPVPPVRAADFRRAEDARRNVVTQASKLPVNLAEAEIEVAGDVLEDDDTGSGFADDPGNVRPQVALIRSAEALSGHGERLAWIASGEHVEPSGLTAPNEGGEVIPDRAVGHGAVAHAGLKGGNGHRLDLDKTGGTSTGYGNGHASFETTTAST
ncbi:MAG: hypothetical protein AAF909_11540 [Pseudomonadota bacterium]